MKPISRTILGCIALILLYVAFGRSYKVVPDQFAIMVAVFGFAAGLWAPLSLPKRGWFSFALMVGTLLLVALVDTLLSAYPIRNLPNPNPLWLIFVVMFFVELALMAMLAFPTFAIAKTIYVIVDGRKTFKDESPDINTMA